MGILIALSAAFGSVPAAAAAPWIPAEPLTPGLDPRLPREAYSSLASGPDAGRPAPATWGELCADLPPDSVSATVPSGMRRADCAFKSAPHPFHLDIDLGFYPLVVPRVAIRPFEVFGGDWQSVRVDPEAGSQWARLPPVAALGLRYPVTAHSMVAFRIGLHRDLSAWK